MPAPRRSQSTDLVTRLAALIAALRDGPLPRPALLARLGAAYPAGDSARRMIDRDRDYLATLGIAIERSATRPPVYTLRGGTPAYTHEDLRALALIRDSVGPGHPQAPQLAALLEQLTADLSLSQRTIYTARQAAQAPLQPAIDYTHFAATIALLERAISAHQLVGFVYRNSRNQQRHHERVESHEIEFYDRHFYLVGYAYQWKQFFDYRIDRLSALQLLDTVPPHLLHERELIPFRYRLAAELAQHEISQRFPEQRIVERCANGDAIIEAAGRSDFFIIQTLLRYRSNAELLDPPWLRAKMRAEIARLRELYE
jgi:predicted DNA-binding transcriptional regulator YafY